ncbi:MAG: hypothetical protein V3S69_00305 [Dehalococcoidales bacterium]
MDWKIRYDDDTTHSGDWKSAPKHGVVNVTVLDATGAWGRFVISGYAPHHARESVEYYVCYPDSKEPFATWDLAPFLDRMAAAFPREDPDLYIKYGRQVDQLHWEKIQNLAAEDTDFPTAKSPRRRASDFPEVE